VLVHHRSPATLIFSVDRLVEEGIAPERVVVVDNSEDPAVLARLKEVLEDRARVISVANKGYGNAANEGLRLVATMEPSPVSVLVATHEVVPDPGAVNALEHALEEDPRLGAVGPTLISTVRGEGRRVTTGGTLTPILNRPVHRQPEETRGDSRKQVECDWLDGAFVLYRLDAVATLPFREEFFLYYEETELHARLLESGWRIAVVVEAIVRENSSGIPARLRGRNLQWYQQLHGNRLQRLATVPLIMLKAAASALLKRQGLSETKDMLAGWWAAVHSPLRRL
jgi:GT2 family glycosyltransferase